MMTIMWVFMSVVIVIAIWYVCLYRSLSQLFILTMYLHWMVLYRWRRSNYTLFYITHLFSIIFFIATIMHAWSFWYFAAGPLFLWFYDRLVRWYRASTSSVALVAMEYNAATNITKLELPREAFTHYAGQYAYLQLSILSPLEWHPFTMSSPPSGATRTFHIKAEAPGSWTYRLAREAERLNSGAGVQGDGYNNGYQEEANGYHHKLKPHLPVISVDAPYGRASYIEGHTSLLMVGGGIGATPFISLFSELYSRVCSAERGG
jgi:respiratory burst oxidase